MEIKRNQFRRFGRGGRCNLFGRRYHRRGLCRLQRRRFRLGSRLGFCFLLGFQFGYTGALLLQALIFGQRRTEIQIAEVIRFQRFLVLGVQGFNGDDGVSRALDHLVNVRLNGRHPDGYIQPLGIVDALIRNKPSKLSDNAFKVCENVRLLFLLDSLIVRRNLRVDLSHGFLDLGNNLVHFRLEAIIRGGVHFADADSLVVESLNKRVQSRLVLLGFAHLLVGVCKPLILFQGCFDLRHQFGVVPRQHGRDQLLHGGFHNEC